jgi:hypothetical protein
MKVAHVSQQLTGDVQLVMPPVTIDSISEAAADSDLLLQVGWFTAKNNL